MHQVKRGTRTYVYRSYQDADGKIRKQYLGKPSEGDLSPEERRRRVEARAQQAREKRKLQALLEIQARQLAEAHEAVVAQAREYLIAGGYHDEHRHWRKRRSGRSGGERAGKTGEAAG